MAIPEIQDQLKDLRDRALAAKKPDFTARFVKSSFTADDILLIFSELDDVRKNHREEQGRSADRLRTALGRVSSLERALQAQLDGRS